MTHPLTAATPPVHLAVLQQFRVIYGTMRQYFREVEDRASISVRWKIVADSLAHRCGFCRKCIAARGLA